MASDQYEIDSEFVGTYTDIVVVTNFSQSKEKLGRQYVGNRTFGVDINNFKKIQTPFSTRLKFLSGSFFGNIQKNFNLSLESETESYLDSYPPNPITILQTNNLQFPRLDSNNDKGKFEKGNFFNNKPALTHSINIFLSTAETNKFADFNFDANSFLDSQWLKNPYPFSTPYKGINRIFKTSNILTENIILSNDITGSATSSVETNQLGSIYFTLPTIIKKHFNTVLTTYSSSISGATNKPPGVSPVFSNRGFNAIESTIATGSDGNTNLSYLAIGVTGTFASSKNGYLFDVFATGRTVGGLDSPSERTGSGLDFSSFGTIGKIFNGVEDISYSIQTGSNYNFGCWGVVTTDLLGGTSVLFTYNKFPTKVGWREIGDSLISADYGQSGLDGAIIQIKGIEYSNKFGVPGTSMWMLVGTSLDGNGQAVYAPSWNPQDEVPSTRNSWTSASFSTTPTASLNKVQYFHYAPSGSIVPKPSGSAPGQFFIVGSDGAVFASVASDETSFDKIGSLPNVELTDLACFHDGDENVYMKFVGKDTTNGQGVVYNSYDRGATISIDPTPSDVIIGVKEFHTAEAEGFIGSGTSGSIWFSSPSGSFVKLPSNFDSDADLTNIDMRDVIGSTMHPNGVPKYISDDDMAKITAVGYPSLNPYFSNPLFFKVVDMQTDTFFDSSNNEFVNGAAAMPVIGYHTHRSYPFHSSSTEPKIIRPSYEDIVKSFYGVGEGIKLNLTNIVLSSSGEVDIQDKKETIFFRNKVPSYTSIAYVNGLQKGVEPLESVRLLGPTIRQWRYGILNGLPLKTKTVFRRGKFGQFRDMLEQRKYSAFLNTKEGKFTISFPIKINFIEESVAATINKEYDNTTTKLSTNPEDSGIYDTHYRSGKPFNDLDSR